VIFICQKWIGESFWVFDAVKAAIRRELLAELIRIRIADVDATFDKIARRISWAY